MDVESRIGHGRPMAREQLAQRNRATGSTVFNQAHGPHPQKGETASAGVAAWLLQATKPDPPPTPGARPGRYRATRERPPAARPSSFCRKPWALRSPPHRRMPTALMRKKRSLECTFGGHINADSAGSGSVTLSSPWSPSRAHLSPDPGWFVQNSGLCSVLPLWSAVAAIQASARQSR